MHGNLVRIASDYAVAQLNSHPQNLSWIARYPEFLCFATFFRGFYFDFILCFLNFVNFFVFFGKF
jgi:hypothetical protein